MSVNSKMTAIADAIRAKTGGTAALTLDEMDSAIASIPEKIDTSGTAVAADIYEGKTATVNDVRLTGSNPYNAANVDPAVANALAALAEKGVDTSGKWLADIAGLIASIEAGGGGVEIPTTHFVESGSFVCTGEATSALIVRIDKTFDVKLHPAVLLVYPSDDPEENISNFMLGVSYCYLTNIKSTTYKYDGSTLSGYSNSYATLYPANNTVKTGVVFSVHDSASGYVAGKTYYWILIGRQT